MIETSPAGRATSRPRTSTLERAALMKLAAVEYERFAVTLDDLTPDEWATPTECATWDVRAMASHALGMAEMAATIREGRRQQKAAVKRGGTFIDALTALQVEERLMLTGRQLSQRYATVGPRAARARRRTPALIRRRKLPIDQIVGGQRESWTFGYLFDTIMTRDPWMHRIDIGRATRRPLALTAEHDGVLVADVATEWGARHNQPCRLVLDGPAGGVWTFGSGGPTIQLDAIEFCRILSGREPATGLLATEVPF